jgi:hypothetical protein
MVSDVPIIPVIEAVDWYQYDTGTFSGWPTPGNSYAQPSPYAYPDNEQVLLRLSPSNQDAAGRGFSGKSPARGSHKPLVTGAELA